MEVLCQQRQQQVECTGTLLSNWPPTATEMRKHIAFKGPSIATVMCKYLALKGALTATVMYKYPAVEGPPVTFMLQNFDANIVILRTLGLHWQQP